jgi:hypothetical protein
MKLVFCRKGVSVLEFAIILPLLLVILFGIIEFGFLMYNQQVITNAAREGARYGVVFKDPAVTVPEILDVVDEYVQGHLVTLGGTGGNLVPSADRTCGQGSYGASLTVGVTYDYGFLVLANLVPGIGITKQLSSQAVMKCE